MRLLGLCSVLFVFGCGGGSHPVLHLDMGAGDGGGCGAGLTSCNGMCKNLAFDNANCGTCGHACPNGQSCNNSQCGGGGCMGNQIMCNNVCTDVTSDSNNCGMCGKVCQTGSCVNSVCSGGNTGTATCVDIFNCYVNMMCMDNNCFSSCNMTMGGGKMPNYSTDAMALYTCVNTHLGNPNDPCAAANVCGMSGTQMACGQCLYGTCSQNGCQGGECSAQATPCAVNDM